MPSELFEYDSFTTVSCKSCGDTICKGDTCATTGFGLYYLCEDCVDGGEADA